MVRETSDVKEPGLPITHLFAGVPVAEFNAALPWYERFFDTITIGHVPS
jgi:hypothetical protein